MYKKCETLYINASQNILFSNNDNRIKHACLKVNFLYYLTFL